MNGPLKKDLIRLNLGTKAPRCPLCVDNAHQHEHFMEKKFEPNRGFFIFACDNYKVAIRVDDPFVGKWDAAYAKAGRLECAGCNATMRYFCTSTGYMKAVCPKRSCGVTIHNAEVDRDRSADAAPLASPDAPSTLQ